MQWQRVGQAAYWKQHFRRQSEVAHALPPTLHLPACPHVCRCRGAAGGRQCGGCRHRHCSVPRRAQPAGQRRRRRPLHADQVRWSSCGRPGLGFLRNAAAFLERLYRSEADMPAVCPSSSFLVGCPTARQSASTRASSRLEPPMRRCLWVRGLGQRQTWRLQTNDPAISCRRCSQVSCCS